MGLNCSHDAFDGAYSAFNRFRQTVCKAVGGSYPPHDDKSLDENRWYFPDYFTNEAHPGLVEFLSHSDYDGYITPKMCIKIADELEEILPEMEKLGIGSGHISSAGGYRKVTEKFITGCQLAASKNENLEFK